MSITCRSNCTIELLFKGVRASEACCACGGGDSYVVVPGCTDSNATNYNPNADVDNGTCTYPTPSITLNFNPTAIKRGETSTLSWSVSNSTSRTLTGQGNVGTSGSLNYSPTNTISRTLSANYYGITSSSVTKTLTVYIPPIFNISTKQNYSPGLVFS